MHNGLYFYNDNPTKSAGLIPAFTCLGIGTRFLIAILNEIESDKVNTTKEKLEDLLDRLDKEWMIYFKKYVQPNS